MLIEIGLLVVGLVLLTKGADWLINGASDVAAYLKVPPIYAGLTVVAFGTSLPELVVTVYAAVADKASLAVGNVIGSNIANLGFIVGIAALIKVLPIKRRTLHYEFLIVVVLSFLLAILGNKNYIFGENVFYFGMFDGFIFLTIFVIFVFYILRSIKKGEEPFEKEFEAHYSHKNVWWKNTVFLILGPAMLFMGGKWVVESASALARLIGVSEAVIGLSLVSLGTSLPELFTTVIAAKKYHSDIAIGNIIGSNIFNITLVLGAASMFTKLVVEPSLLYVDAMIMILITLIALFFGNTRKKFSKPEGLLLLLVYIGYMAFLFLR